MNSDIPEKPDTGNYFRFYGLEEKFDIDPVLIKQIYIQLSKKYHPDLYGENPETQNLAVTLSAYNNSAYKTLSNEISRAQYLTGIKLNRSAEKTGELPSSFLMEMMDLNEAIDEQNNEQEIKIKLNILREETMLEIRNHAAAGNWEQTEISVMKWKYLERLGNRLS